MGKRSFAARLQQLFSAHDMTLGAPWKRILEFAIPLLIGNLAQQLYNLSLIHISRLQAHFPAVTFLPPERLRTKKSDC